MPEPSRRLEGATLPHRLSDLPCPPEALYLQGELPRAPGVAIVGTRHPTPEAVEFTEALAARVAEAGIVVLSGGAVGIDSAAHRGALNAQGQTVVVAPAGFLAPYPEENVELFRQVVTAGGAYLSLAPDREPATSAAFFPRNACLVALAEVVVVVEAGHRSGSRNAARWARALARPLLVVPASPWNERGAGCVIELRRGAGFCTEAKDIFDALERRLLHPIPRGPSPPPPGNTPRQVEFSFQAPAHPLQAGSGVESVCRAIASGAETLDAICDRTGLPAKEVQKHVLTLTLEGALAPDPAGRLLPIPPASLVSVSKSSKRLR